MSANTHSSPSEINDRFDSAMTNIANACARAGRKRSDVALSVVTKKHDAERIRPLLERGHRVFGENRVQEAQQKWPALLEAFPDTQLRLIGPLQTNKVKDAIKLFDVIETVDRPKLAAALAKALEGAGNQPRLLVQVNTGNEPQKSGIAPHEAVRFVEHCQKELGLTISGLMCIPPQGENPGPHFALLKKLNTQLGLRELSMGMSADYEIAVSLGATHVRIGSAIMGPRD